MKAHLGIARQLLYSGAVSSTSADVAKLAGVSRGAVSQILNGRGQRFADATRERVLRAAAELSYQPSTAGRALAMGSSDIVLALVPNTTFGGKLQDVFQAATEDLARHGLTLLLHLATSSTAPLDRVITGMKPRAAISLTPFTDEERALLHSRGTQAFDPISAGVGGGADVAIGMMQANHLLDRGYRTMVFAHLQDERQDPFGQDRELGVKAVCLERGLPGPTAIRLGIDPDSALTALRSVAAPGVGIACYNDDVATALISAANAEGWQIPAQLGFIGMDNTPLSAVTYPPLTTIGYDVGAAAHALITVTLSGLGESVDERSSSDPGFTLVTRGTT